MARTVPYFLDGVPQLVAADRVSRAAAVTAGAIPGFEYATGPITDADLLLPVILTDRELREKLAPYGVTGTDDWSSADLAIELLARKGFTALDRVEITELDVATDVEAGGAAVEITGTGFSNGREGTTTVTFGGEAATSVVVVSNTVITCVAPAHAAGDVDVVVSNDNGSHTLVEGFEYTEE